MARLAGAKTRLKAGSWTRWRDWRLLRFEVRDWVVRRRRMRGGPRGFVR